MKNKSCYNLAPRRPAISRRGVLLGSFFVLAALGLAPQALAGGDAPGWMHALTSVPLPAHDEKTDAVLLYSETNVTVVSVDKIKTQVREAYKILRPDGREYGFVHIDFRSPGQKITGLRGWCIPAQGKDYEVKDKEAMDMAMPGIPGSELIDDVKVRVIHIPASDPGNIVGYEYEKEERPLVLQAGWDVQGEIPSRERHFSLQLPPGWEYKAAWLNFAEVKPAPRGSNQWEWVVNDVKGIRLEEDMPPWQGLAGQMIVSFFSTSGPAANVYRNWGEMGTWYQGLLQGRSDASPEIKQKVKELTASASTQVAKMRALAQFVQHDIRYVAIELGVGGWQPHPATDTFAHRYGDCKDKATLMRSMLHEIGVESYHVVVNTRRGSVAPDMPAHHGFNHAIVAIKLPDGLADSSLVATIQHPKLGRLLFYDPTYDVMVPFGHIGGYLQSNYGLLVGPDGGELVELPKEPAAMNSITRTGKLTLDVDGNLQGDVKEVRLGDRASSERWALSTVSKDADKIKPIEELLAGSLSNFHITRATVTNLQHSDQPFGFNYSFQAGNYAKTAGDLILVRPRVLGSKAKGLLETKEPRLFPIEFEGPLRDTDSFEITIPAGFAVDDLPPAVDADYSFASYHSKTEAQGNMIRYTRDFEVKELSVSVNKAEELKKFYRIIAADERNTAVLKPVAKP